MHTKFVLSPKQGIKKLTQTIIIFLLLLSTLPLDAVKVYAASKYLGISPISRASGIAVDSFAVNEMIIEYLKPRSVSQTALKDLAAGVLPGGGTDSMVAAELIDDILRIYGLPVSRQYVSSSVTLQSLIKNSIDANLPVVLIGTNHQVVVDGYNDISGFSVRVLDPATGQGAWSSIIGVTLSSPVLIIQEIITVHSSVTIKTAEYGTILFSTTTNSLSGGTPPSSTSLKEAIKSVAPYVVSSDTVYLINYGTGTNNLGLYAALLKANQQGGVALVRDVLQSWDQNSFGDSANFPLLPLDNNGYLDISTLKQDVRNLGLVYSIYPNSPSLSSFSKISQEEIEGLISEHNHFFLNHNYVENRQAVFTQALREMVSSRGQLSSDELASEHQSYAVYILELSKMLVEMGHTVDTTISITKDIADIIDPDVLWGKTWKGLYESGLTRSESVSIANRVRAKHKAIKRFMDVPGTGSVIQLGLGGAEQLILAAQPVVFLEETRDELVAVQAKLGYSGDDLLLRESITQIVNEIDGNSSVFWGKLKGYWDSGQMVVDLAEAAFDATMDFMLQKATTWGVPVVGQVYAAISLGLMLGDMLTHNQEVHDKLHFALYAKDMEAIFHRIAYSEMRPALVSQYQNGSVITNDLVTWDSAVHLTYLSEVYYWKNIADAYNATGLLTNLLTAWNGYGTAKEVAEEYFLPNAIKASKYASNWTASPSVQAVLDTTEKLLFSRKAGAVIAQVIDPLDGASVNGVITIQYLADATVAPIDIILDIDGVTLDSKTNVNPEYYQYSWNSSAYNNGLPHALHLKVTDNNGVIAEDNVTVVVGSPGNGNIAPSIELLGPNNEKAFRYYNIHWTDYDPDDNAIITLGYDTNNTGCDGTTIQNWISEDWTTNWWTWRNLPGTSGSSYWVYAIIKDDMHDPKCVYSPGKLTIETPSSGNGYVIDHVEVDDEDYGDGDGIWESEERVDLAVFIKNVSSVELTDVYGVISVSGTSIAINDAEDTIWASTPGIIRDGVFEVTAIPGFSGNVPIQLDIYYRENGGILKKDTETLNVLVSPIGSEPSFQIKSITFTDNDLTQADGDGIPESGEDDVYTTIELRNSGGAPATNVSVVVSQPAGFTDIWRYVDRDYPDIAPNASAIPTGTPFALNDIPVNFSGSLTQSLTIYYGVNQEFSKTLNFVVTINPTPRIKVLNNAYAFGQVNPGTLVTYDFSVTNVGSQTAIISSVTPSNADLSFPSYPSSIAPGTTVTFTARLDTTGLDASIVRTFTINSNAHLLSKNTGQLSGTVHQVTGNTYEILQSIPLANEPTNIGGGDTDGDGLREIILTIPVWDQVGTNNYTTVEIWEQTTAGSSTYSKVWNSGTSLSQVAGNYGSMKIGDIDGDGKDDVVIATTNPYYDVTHRVYYLKSNGNNSMAIYTVASSTTYSYSSVAIGDSDGDSYKEIIVGARNPTTPVSQFSIIERTSGTSFTTRWTSPFIHEWGYPSNETAICAIASGNTDNDAYGEVLIGTDDGQVQIFESTGNNSYSSTPKLSTQVGSSVGGTYSWCDLMVANLDNDNKSDIVYINDDSDKAWIFETSGNDVWAVVWTEVIDPNTIDLYRVDSGDTDGDGKFEFVVTYRSPDGIAIYETFGDNSYASIFRADATTAPTKVPDTPTGVDIVNLDASSLPEILVGSEYYGYWILGLVQPKDLVINNWNIVFDPISSSEAITVAIYAQITNAGVADQANVLVNFYNGDPSSGGTLLGTSTIPTLALGASRTISITQAFANQGSYMIFVVVDPNNTIAETDENNNKASALLNILDNDTWPPEIRNISIHEYNGDGDSLIEDDELVLVNWIATDLSGINSTSVIIDCTVGTATPTGGSGYQVVVGPCIAGVHSFTISATDADNSPLTTTTLTSTLTIHPNQPIITAVSPVQNATNVSRYAPVRAWFGTNMIEESVITNTFTLQPLGGQVISGTLTYDPVSNQATFVPSVKLQPQTLYKATLRGGINGIKDQNNNILTEDYTWQFTTQPNQAPDIPYVPIPSDGQSDVSVVAGLSWQAMDHDGDPLTFTVYLGTSNPPTSTVCVNVKTFACGLGSLSEGQTYYWRVVANDGSLTTQSPVWSFVTHIRKPEFDMAIQDDDAAPDLADGSDFGTANIVGDSISHTFTINNLGDANLILNGTPRVVISGTNASDFLVALQPTNTIVPSTNVTFTVVFDPSAVGVRTAVVSIENNDANENPYNFSIQGTGVATTPEIDVRGKGVPIINGSITPSTNDNTDFGSTFVTDGTVTHIFTISNTGNADLLLTGNPKVAVSGTNAADFTVIMQPSGPIPGPSGWITFTVMFDPSAVGLRTATISMSNNDSNENPYTFAVQGTGDLIATTTTITSDGPDPSLINQIYLVTVTVSAMSGTPTGTVTVDDGSASCLVTLSGGNGTCSLTSLTAGVKTLTASYAGNATYSNSSGTTSHTVNSPVPSISSIIPISIAAGGPAFNLIVNGTNFVAGSTVRWNGTERSTTMVTSTQLTATIGTLDITSSGTVSVTVFSPAPGGGVSNSQVFTVTPQISQPCYTLTRTHAGSGSDPTASPSNSPSCPVNQYVAGATITVTASPSVNYRVMNWSGTISDTSTALTNTVTMPTNNHAVSAVYVPTQYSIPFSDDFSADKGWTNPLAGYFSRDTNNQWLNWHIYRSADEKYYLPIQPYTGDFQLEFRFKDTYFANNNDLYVGLAESLTGGVGNGPSPTGFFVDVGWFGDYTPRTFIRPYAFFVDQGPYEGSRISNNMNTWYRVVLQRSGTGWTVTLFDDVGTQLGQITGSFPAAHTTFNYIMFWNPNNGDWPTADGLLDDLIVTGPTGPLPAPSIMTITPSSAAVGTPGMNLTINGTNFVSDSTVKWNSAFRTTSYVSSTQVSAFIPASDLTSAGTSQIQVYNPTAINKSSNSVNFDVIKTNTAITLATTPNPSAFGQSITLTATITSTLNVPTGNVIFKDGGITIATLPLASSAAKITSGANHTCIITPSGGVKCWGNNSSGQLGDGTTTTRLTPVDVSGLNSGVISIVAGELHTCALLNSGGVKCWGSNTAGQLGDGTTVSRNTPVNVSGLMGSVKSITAGWWHTCAVLADGSAMCWGTNAAGQLGDNSTVNRTTPVNVSGLTSGVNAISAGAYQTCVLLQSGGVRCWGKNYYGQLGDGTTTDRLTPIDVNGLNTGVKAIAAGAEHTCALTASGGVKCWGKNTYGEVGDGTLTHRSTPVNVTGLASGIERIVGGYYHTCALTASGGAKCWGGNSSGQLGDNTTTQRATPVDVIYLTNSVNSITTFGEHTCALTASGSAKCWGLNTNGQLGDGTTTQRSAPVTINSLNTNMVTLTSSTLSAGLHSITAEYSGDERFNASTTSPLAPIVNPATTASVIINSTNSSVFGQTVYFTATVNAVAPGSGLPSGTVTFKNGVGVFGTATLSNGMATVSKPNMSPGVYTITVEYAGNDDFTGSISAALPLTVSKASTTSSLASSSNPSVLGESVTFTTVVTRSTQANAPVSSPTGTVTFKDNGSDMASCVNLALSGSGQAACTLTTLITGTHSITVNYSGNSNYNASTSSVVSQVVSLPTTSITLTSSGNLTSVGQSVLFTATMTSNGGVPVGTVIFKDGATTIGTGTLSGGSTTFTTSSLALGAHSISAVYGGSGNFSSSTSAVLTQTVGSALVKGTITPSGGGTIQSTDGKFRITFPANAVSSTITVHYLELSSLLHTLNSKTVVRAFILEARDSGQQLVTLFNQPYALVLSYSDSELSAKRVGETSVGVTYWNGSQWIDLMPCSGCSLDRTNNRVTLVTNHFTEFALAGTTEQINLFIPFVRK